MVGLRVRSFGVKGWMKGGVRDGVKGCVKDGVQAE